MRSIIASLSTGYIFFYFSELVFWARPKPEDNLLNWFQTWIAYSIMAFLYLSVVQKFKVRSLPALFLAGAFFGWLAEGIIVQTTYEDLPLSISFTGLAWHSLITVVLGWYGLQTALRKGLRTIIQYAVLTGIVLWFWGVTWIFEEPATVASPLVFSLYTFASTCLLAFSLFISSRSFDKPFAPSVWVIRFVAGVFILLYIMILLSGLFTALILIPLMAILYFTLRKNAWQEPRENILEEMTGKIPFPHYAALLLIPLVSSILYAIYFEAGLKLPTNWVIYLVTTPAGFTLFGWSMYKIWKNKIKTQPNLKA